MKNIFIASALLLLLQVTAINAQHIVSTYAGSTFGYEDGDTAVAKFRGPFGMCVDAGDNLFIADADNHCIRKISADGIVSTYAGTGVAGFADGPALTAQFNSPSDLCLDDEGNLFVSDFANQRIRMIDTDGNVTTIAGNGNEGYLDGVALESEFDYPRGIVIDSNGELFIADSWNHRIRKIDMTIGMVTTFAGGGENMGVSSEGALVDGADTSARFYTPSGLSIDADDIIYLADAYNHRIRMITPAGIVSTVAGSGGTGPGAGGYSDGVATSSFLNTPTELFVAQDNKIYIGDTYNNMIRLLEDGNLSTVAGNGNSGYADGPAEDAEFKFTRGVVADASGNHLYVCDYNNRRIRKVWLNVPVGFNEFANIHQFISVYPIPSNGTISVDLSQPAGTFATIKFFSGNGTCVMHEEKNISGEFTLQLQDRFKGIYFLRIESADQIWATTVILE